MKRIERKIVKLRESFTVGQICAQLGISRRQYSAILKSLLAGGLAAPVKKGPRFNHGQHGSRLYKIWLGMKQRCGNSNFKQYSDYGGRGITVCQSWQSFPPFAMWAKANGYASNLTLDRRNNSKGYMPSNCRWATRSQQQSNRRKAAGTISRFVGVTWIRGAWVVQIVSKGVYYYGGRFKSEVKAAKVRDALARKLHGNYATLNFPKSTAA